MINLSHSVNGNVRLFHDFHRNILVAGLKDGAPFEIGVRAPNQRVPACYVTTVSGKNIVSGLLDHVLCGSAILTGTDILTRSTRTMIQGICAQDFSEKTGRPFVFSGESMMIRVRISHESNPSRSSSVRPSQCYRILDDRTLQEVELFEHLDHVALLNLLVVPETRLHELLTAGKVSQWS